MTLQVMWRRGCARQNDRQSEGWSPAFRRMLSTSTDATGTMSKVSNCPSIDVRATDAMRVRRPGGNGTVGRDDSRCVLVTVLERSE
jgi:hypothetical protein